MVMTMNLSIVARVLLGSRDIFVQVRQIFFSRDSRERTSSKIKIAFAGD